jgi:hypothetical protein
MEFKYGWELDAASSMRCPFGSAPPRPTTAPVPGHWEGDLSDRQRQSDER